MDESKHLKHYFTKSDNGYNFFHAVFGEFNAEYNQYEAANARSMKGEWHKFYCYFDSLEDPKMPDPLRAILRTILPDDPDISDYRHYRARVKQELWYVFKKEIPIIAALANIRIVVHTEDGEITSHEPKPELLGSYKRNCEIWGEKKEAVICVVYGQYLRAELIVGCIAPKEITEDDFCWPENFLEVFDTEPAATTSENHLPVENTLTEELVKMESETSRSAILPEPSTFETKIIAMPRKRRFSAENFGEKETTDRTKRNRICLSGKSNKYSASGLKYSLHGNIYQLKLLMLFLKRGLNLNYVFQLATEIDAAEKFDDLMFRYENLKRDKICYRYLQAKHKLDKDKNKIKASHLLTEKDGEFGLPKYFRSFYKIMKKFKLNDGGIELKDFIICTNINFDFVDLQKAKVGLIEISEVDEFFQYNTAGLASKPLRYKIDIDETHKLYTKLKKKSDRHILVETLADCVINDRPLSLSLEIFKCYHVALSEEIIDIQNKKFYSKFVNNDVQLSDAAKNLRKLFLKYIKIFFEPSMTQTEIDSAWEKLCEKELKIIGSFGKAYKLKGNPQISNLDLFVKEFFNLLMSAKMNVVEISKHNSQISFKDINNLAGHVLVIKNKELKFSYAFMNDEPLPGNLIDFRNELKTLLKYQNINFIEFAKFEFKIDNFKTCDEEQLRSKPILPCDKIDEKDIEGFFKKLVFAVNQPSEVELGTLIGTELGEEFNLLDSELITDSFQRRVLDWMKIKEGIFLTREDASEFFESIRRKIFKVILIGPTSEYCSKLKKIGIDFQNFCSELIEFLKNFDNQIFNLICSSSTKFGALMVYQVLRNLERFQKIDSFIFIRAKFFLRMKNYVSLAFKETDCNLLVIDCQEFDSEISSQEFIDKLFQFVNSIDNFDSKKIILISQETFFNRCNLNKLVENRQSFSFNHLTIESQNKLMKKKVTFQGEQIVLNELMLENSKSLIDLETLLRLMENRKVTIGKKLNDLGDVRECYIERKFCFRVEIKNKVVEDARIEKFMDLLVINNEEEEFIQKIKDNYSRTIHWLVKDSGKLVWKKSHLSIANLAKYREKNLGNLYDRNVYSFSEDELIIDENSNKIVLISDTAGMGKSTVLTNLALTMKKHYPNLMVIRLNLNEYYEELEAEYEFREKNRIFDLYANDVDKALTFLLKLMDSDEQSKLATNFERELFDFSLKNQNNVVLMFDGFDEISFDYGNIIIDLIKGVEKSGVKRIYLTTRPSMRLKLEEQFQVFAYTLEAFSENDQIEFLTKFWQNRNSELTNSEKIRTYSVHLIRKLNSSISDKEKEFTGIPLQIRMVAEIFEMKQEILENSLPKEIKDFFDNYQNERGENVEIPRVIKEFLEDFYQSETDENFDLSVKLNKFLKEHYNLEKRIDIVPILVSEGIKEYYSNESGEPKFPKKFNLLDLYKLFIHKKYFEIYVGEKFRATTVVANCLLNFFYPIFIENHQRLALYRLFVNRKLKILLPNFKASNEENQKLVSRIKNGIESRGIVIQIIKKKPHFIHQTFAEYFTADFITSKLLENRERKTTKEFVLVNILMNPEYQIVRAFMNDMFAYHLKVNNEKISDSCQKSLVGYGKKLHDLWSVKNSPLLDKGLTLLHVAAAESNPQIIEFVCKALKSTDSLESFVNYTEKKQGSALHLAAKSGNLEDVKVLVKFNADVDAMTVGSQKFYGSSALYSAALEGHSHVVEWLVQNGANVNGELKGNKNLKGLTLLHLAAEKKHTHVAKLLMENGADFKAVVEGNESFEGLSVLHYAGVRGEWEIVQLLVEEYEQDINAVVERGKFAGATVLLFADEIETVELLVKLGADIHTCRDKKGRTLLLAAAIKRNWDLVTWLLDRGADINAKDKAGQTALHYATEKNGNNSDSLDSVEWLLENGADVTLLDAGGESPLHYAATNGHIKLASLLVNWVRSKNGPEKLRNFLNSRNSSGKTILHFAVESIGGKPKMVRFLIGEGVDVNIKDFMGRTALHYAANKKTDFIFKKEELLGIVQEITSRNVDVDCKDVDRKTVLDLARESYEEAKFGRITYKKIETFINNRKQLATSKLS